MTIASLILVVRRHVMSGLLRNSVSVLLFVLLALPLGCGKSVPQLPRLEHDDVVLAFGDSLTHGTGARLEESYPRVLSELIGRSVIESGVPGEQTAQARARLAGELEEYRPKILLLCLGGNDMLRKFGADTIEANLRAMIELARSRGVAVVLIGVPRPALFGGTAQFYQRLADEFVLPIEGEVLNEVLRDNALKSDPIHPNARGYRRIAEAIARLLREAGAV